MRILPILLLLLLPVALRAQSVTGTVVDKETGAPLKGVRVAMSNGIALDSTDGQGRFTVSGKGGETFLFTAPGYTQQLRKAPDYVGNVPWRVQMQSFSFSLGEVRVKQFREGYQRDSFERSKTYERTLVRGKSGAMSPVSMLAEKLLKKQKRLFAFQKEFHRAEDQKFIDSRYTPELTAEMTKLSGDTLAHFMNENPMPYEFSRAASDLEIKMWIKDVYKQWIIKN